MIRAILEILSGWRSGVSFRRSAVCPSARPIPLDLSTYRALGRIWLALTFPPSVACIRFINIFRLFFSFHFSFFFIFIIDAISLFCTKQCTRYRGDAWWIRRRTLLLQTSDSKGRRPLHLSSASSALHRRASFLCTPARNKKRHPPFDSAGASPR